MIFKLLFIIIIGSAYFYVKPPLPKFEAQTIDTDISIGYGLALGDVNGDGRPDILLADKKQFVWYRNGDWKKFVMIDSLTKHDNVCIAARDLDGDGKVEVAVGAQWNPGETSDLEESGSVHYLIRPEDPTQLWKAVELHHEPTVHRMQWVKLSNGKFSLLVVPLHGRGNKGGEGEGVRILAYQVPKNIYGEWPIDTLEKSMHLTHNFDVIEDENSSTIILAGKEGIIVKDFIQSSGNGKRWPAIQHPIGEIRIGKLTSVNNFIATIEPMHGDAIVVYPDNHSEKILLDNKVKEGHALAIADFLNEGSDQIVAGWRKANGEGKVGIKLYAKNNAQGTAWRSYWIDEDGMACEDLKVMDLNGDGKVEIVASGRSTHNLKIYWNK